MMITRNQTKINTVLTFAALALTILAGSAPAGVPRPSGINPATGNPWAYGDTYRLVFHTSEGRTAQETDIEVYNAWAQDLADASTAYDIGADDGVTWKVIGSTNDVDARDNTSTNPIVNGTGCPILLLDGTTVVANNNADLWNPPIRHIINLTEQGDEWSYWPWTGTKTDGTKRTGGSDYGPLGSTGQVGQGNASSTTDWIWRIWTGDPPTNEMPLYALSEPLIIGGGAPRNIYPEDDSTIDIGNIDLLWENMTPNNPADPVYVDVWFGTDPISDFNQVVTADPNRTTWTVNALTEGYYYWQVVNYVYGPGHINEPNAIKGDVWRFYAADDYPPSFVDAGIDMITWSGQPVSLDATVVDDGKSPLTIQWSAIPADGVVFAPSAFVVDPNVTITKDTANPSTVTLTLAVNDESYDPTPVEDTMMIDVYDNACQAAIGKGLDPIDPADFDANCITDLGDYAILAAAWLVDYTLSAPAAKP
jgi:hypothetical protein